ILAMLIANEMHARMAALQRRQLRPVADHEFRSRQRQLEEGLDILFDRYPADIKGDGARGIEEGFVAGPEELGIDAPGPDAKMLEASGAEHALKGGRSHHHGCGWGVKPPQRCIAPGQ